MQIYTKILLGMLVGAVIGFTLGPRSAFLEHDLYLIDDGSAVELRLDREDETSRIALPAGVPIEIEVIETLRERVADATGAEHEIPTWALGELEYTKSLALKDKRDQLRTRLGLEATGELARVWLRIDAERLDAGGFLLAHEPVSALGDAVIATLRPVGKLFMRLIKMVIVPLVFASLLVGVASLGDIRKLGRLGGKTVALYLCTTAIAVTIGLFLAEVVEPGSFIAEADRAALQSAFTSAAESKADQAAEAPSTVDNILNIVPLNPVESLAQGNMLQIIFFALIFGIALTILGASESRLVVTFFDKVQQAMIVIIHMVMAFAPFGVAALIAEVIGTSGLSVLMSLLVYSVTVLVGLTLQAVLVYGGLVRFVARLPFFEFLRAIRPAQLVAFSTSSSSATLPVSMECAEENLGVSRPVSSFVLPLGSTVNMDGTALYQGVAAVFIAQAFQMDLSLAAQLGIVLTATMASIGAAGVPGAGMVTLAMVLTAAGIPVVGLALILGMDRILDMFRTAVNVTGDLAVTVSLATSEGEDIRPLSSEEDQADPDRGFEGRLRRDEEPVEPA